LPIPARPRARVDRRPGGAGHARPPVAPPPLDRCHVRGGLPAKELASRGDRAGRIATMGRLAASILSADFAYLADQVKAVEPHADVIHVDVMDAHFVPPLTIGPVVVESLRPHTELPLHCHLMVEAPEALFDDFQAAGTDMVTCHLEALDDPTETVANAR